MKKLGTRIQVYRGKAEHTRGCLTKSQLTLNKRKKIVSKKASESAKRKSNLKQFLVSKKTPKLTERTAKLKRDNTDPRKLLIKKLVFKQKSDTQIQAALKAKNYRSVNQVTLSKVRAWVRKKRGR